ncbi:CotS family spore coat protein [Alloiococcus sp. CFN-8]|uniref:CotS family spore coat protein n=1 Tax=Alloiococcus sp. CFN-8 TaxID=3416081 RepID=UPI003CF52430
MKQEVCFHEHILPREKMLLLKALSHYKCIPKYVYRKRSAYKIVAEEGIFCLKRMRSGEEKVKNGYLVSEELLRSNFIYLAKYITTKDKKLFVVEQGYLFYMTTWIDGREANLNNINEAMRAVRLLAIFHKEVQKVRYNKLNLRNNYLNYNREWKRKLKDLSKYSEIIDKKIIPTEFDKAYKDEISIAYKYGLNALELISNYTYNKINNMETGICHDSYYYQNLIMFQDQLYIIDLDSLILSFQVLDLAKLIRRLMYKDEYYWDFSKARILIEEYDKVKRLLKSELYLIMAVVAFPHRFWKLGRKRYVKGSFWTEDRYLKKLRKIQNCRVLYESFLKDFLNYIELQ